MGVRHGQVVAGLPPYILWIVSGTVPWMFMGEVLNGGTDLFRTHNYLVTKISFPLGNIPTIFIMSSYFIQLVLQIVILIIYFACGLPLDPHLLQVPVLLAAMLVYLNISAALFALIGHQPGRRQLFLK